MQNNAEHYSVVLTDEATYAMVSIKSDRVLNSIQNHMGLLETTPYLGHVYDPAYPASKPPFECRVLFCWRYGIYHIVDDGRRIVTVFAIEDQLRNPETRFEDFDYSSFHLED